MRVYASHDLFRISRIDGSASLLLSTGSGEPSVEAMAPMGDRLFAAFGGASELDLIEIDTETGDYQLLFPGVIHYATSNGRLHADADGIYYYAEAGGIYRASLDGSSSTELVVAEDIDGWPRDYDSDATHLYWIVGDGVVQRVSKEGGAVEILADHREDDLDGIAIALDEEHVYWTTRSDEWPGALWRLPR